MNSNSKAILYLILLLAITAGAKKSKSAVLDEITSDTTSDTSQIVVDGNAIFTSKVTANELVGTTFDVLEGTTVTGSVTTNVLSFDSATISSLTVNKVVAKGSILNIQGNLIVKPAASTSSSSSFLETDSSSWFMHAIETFEQDDDVEAEKTELLGWDTDIFNECASEVLFKNRFLGGHCALSYHEVSKQYDNLPAHKNIKVQAKFHLFDDWRGEAIYIKTDGHIVWSKNITSHNEDHSINLCGGASADPHYNLHAEFALPHAGKDLKLTFGSTLERDPCEVSYAIDDVVLLIK